MIGFQFNGASYRDFSPLQIILKSLFLLAAGFSEFSFKYASEAVGPSQGDVIGPASSTDTCPCSGSDRGDALRLCGEPIPGSAAGESDIVAGVEDPVLSVLPRRWARTFSTEFSSGLYGGRCSRVMPEGTASRLKPSRRSTVVMLRSAGMTPSLASMYGAKSARRQRTTPGSARSGPRRTHPATQASCRGERNRFAPNSTCQSLSPARPSSLVRCTRSRAASGGPSPPPAPPRCATCPPAPGPGPACDAMSQRQRRSGPPGAARPGPGLPG